MSWRQAFQRSANRSTTPTPGAPDGHDSGDDTTINNGLGARVGLLTVRVTAARALAPASLPAAIRSQLSSPAAKQAAAVSPSTVTQQRANLKKGHRPQDSVQRKNCWWLPYAVLEFVSSGAARPCADDCVMRHADPSTPAGCQSGPHRFHGRPAF